MSDLVQAMIEGKGVEKIIIADVKYQKNGKMYAELEHFFRDVLLELKAGNTVTLDYYFDKER